MPYLVTEFLVDEDEEGKEEVDGDNKDADYEDGQAGGMLPVLARGGV